MEHKQEWFTLIEFTLTADQLRESCAADRVISTLHGVCLAAAYRDRVEQAIRASLLRAVPDNHALSIRVFTSDVDAALAPDVGIAPAYLGFFLVDRIVPGDAEGKNRLIEVFLYAENHQPD
jgi:hypothetical protein